MEPPKRARIWLPSMTEVDQSIRPAAFSPRNSSRCSRSHTPADCHSAKRRCAVAGEQPISVGRCRQAMPVNRTKTIALKHTRSSTRGRPPRGSGGCSGSNGEIACHSSSRTCQVDLATRTPPRPGLCHPTKFARQASNPPMGGIETASKGGPISEGPAISGRPVRPLTFTSASLSAARADRDALLADELGRRQGARCPLGKRTVPCDLIGRR